MQIGHVDSRAVQHAHKYWGKLIVCEERGKFTVVIIYFLQFILTIKAVSEIKGITFHKHAVHMHVMKPT
jgi:hypothetical protein